MGQALQPMGGKEGSAMEPALSRWRGQVYAAGGWGFNARAGGVA
jgi:hypothetical protein